MEFWGVEVKGGEPLRVESGDGFILHLSQACLGEAKKDKGNESVCLFVNFDDQKLVLGTLSYEKIPQIPFDLVFEKDFELSHNLKNGSVFFSGYKVAQPEYPFTQINDLPIPVDNGKKEAKQPNPENENAAKPDSKQKVKIVEPNKDGKPKPENDDSSDEEDDSSDDGESSDDQAMMMANDEDESSEDEDDESDEEDDDSDDGDVKTPKKVGVLVSLHVNMFDLKQYS
ncbi:histone deacetylase HDT1 [Populus alba x Populus x berolinensis]|uniref:Histone deacetylase HDT1 n=1 Tax=Populus alba x Populus x berolinensis TaxID=444605 RepID=A0AAD6QMZ3_9ROSI|nr:histone deacetylase HDT1 [Populus alba x Populus x berolinensis]